MLVVFSSILVADTKIYKLFINVIQYYVQIFFQRYFVFYKKLIYKEMFLTVKN